MKIAQLFVLAVMAVVLSAPTADAGLFGCFKKDSCCEPVCCEEEVVCCEEEVVCEEPVEVVCEEPAPEPCCEPEPECCEPEPTCCEPEPCCEPDPCCKKKLFGGLLSKFRGGGCGC